MKRPKYPNPLDAQTVDALVVMVSGVASAVGPDEPDSATAMVGAGMMLDALKARITGNRGGGVPVMWADLRYLLVGALRAIADRLDGNLVDAAG